MSDRALSSPLASSGRASCPTCKWELRWLVASGPYGSAQIGDFVITPMHPATVTAKEDPSVVISHTKIGGSPGLIRVPGPASVHVLLRARCDGHGLSIERKGLLGAVEVDPCR